MRHTIAKSLFGALLIGLIMAVPADAGGVLDSKLAQRLALDGGPQEVIITFTDRSGIQLLQDELGTGFLALSHLPMAGAVLTEAQIDEILQWDSVESIYYNDTLEYYNYTSGEITGGHYVHDNLGVKGSGVTIAILDSGVDATHPDLPYGDKVVQNVKILGDLDLLGGITVPVEGLPNSDTTSGHGTHVAGTVAGNGAASADDERRSNYHAGIAPEATLVGIGAGDAISILYALQGFDYAIGNRDRYGIDIITNSWGGGDGAAFDPDNPINVASYEAYRQGIVVTFAASNSGPDEDTLNQYAIAPWVINVAAGTPDKTLADFSSRGVAGDFYKHPDVTAPGEGIVSTRAANTVLPVLGPVLDPAHPEYHLYYASMSGTSMATPFIAGTAALLLEANPQLSPDQIEEILIGTAEAMPGYAEHEVGAGYVDVRAAVEQALNTVGERQAFLAGDTKWSRDGEWNALDDGDAVLQYYGNWRTQGSAEASEGVYREARAGRGGSVFVRFNGTSVKFDHPVDTRGGAADVYVDGVHYERISFFNEQLEFGRHSAIGGLAQGDHLVELRAIDGRVYLDSVLIDGRAFAPDVQFAEQHYRYTGTMGPSLENLSVHEIPFDAGADAVNVNASLEWTGLLDLDLVLVDPTGAEVASAATLGNPETLAYSLNVPGTYTWRIAGYASVYADYELNSTVTRALQP